MRGADAGDAIARVPALAALWAGLLYDAEVLDSAWERIRTWNPAERHAMEIGVARHGFKTPFRGQTVGDLGRWMLDLARQGLEQRGYRNRQGRDESGYLEPLYEAALAGRTFAEELVQRLEKQWQGDIDRAIRVLCAETLA
jgi:glutamate--cysteine ligase